MCPERTVSDTRAYKKVLEQLELKREAEPERIWVIQNNKIIRGSENLASKLPRWFQIEFTYLPGHNSHFVSLVHNKHFLYLLFALRGHFIVGIVSVYCRILFAVTIYNRNNFDRWILGVNCCIVNFLLKAVILKQMLC